MAVTIQQVRAVEIIDSIGRPALEVRMDLAGGASGSACVPMGPDCTGGLVPVLGEVVRELGDASFDELADLDAALRKFGGVDGADDDLGPRPGFQAAIRGLSIAAARAMASGAHVPLWRFLAAPDTEQRLPVPQFTLVNGGRRAGTALDFEEFMIAPVGAPSVRAAVHAGADIHRRLRTVLADSELATPVGDDGGFTPEIDWPERVLELIVETIADAGYTLGPHGIAIVLRVAAAGFRRDGGYRMAGERLSSAELVTRYEQMAEDFPIWSIEDALAPDDWDGWADLAWRLGDRVQLVGGDVFAAGPELSGAAVTKRVANAALIVMAQFGTVTETLEAMRACREAGYAQVVAHRGETSDAFIADLAVAAGCGQLQGGAPTRGERVANYNRLIEIEADDGLAYGV
jgi:enolase